MTRQDVTSLVVQAPTAALKRFFSHPVLPHALAILTLSVFAALLLRATLLRGGAMLGFDLFNYFYPGKAFLAASLARGELPLWNPATFFGAPFLANVQMAALYPPTLLFLLLEFPRAVAVSQWLHLSLGAAGVYLLCRHSWRLGPLPGVAGALAFAGGGFFGAHMGHLNQVHAGIWLPWMALCQFGLARSIGARSAGRVAKWTVGAGVACALQVLAGHTQEAYYSLFALGLLALAFTAAPPAWAPARIAHLPAFCLLAANGALLAAAQLAPALELSRFSYRSGGVPLEEAVAFGVERMYVLESLLPTFWSLPSQEVIGYVGVAGLAMALGALASPSRRTVIALAALAVFAVTLTLSTYTPLYPVLHRFVPMFDSFRAPGRWLLVSTFALAGLAAHGLDALRWRISPESRERRALAYALGVAATGVLLVAFAWRSEQVHAIHWLPHSRVATLWLTVGLASVALGIASALVRSPWPRVALCVALALELGYAARKMEYNQPGDARLYSEQPAVAHWLARQAQEGPADARTVSFAAEERLDGERLRLAVPDGTGDHRRYAAMREVLRPNLGTIYGLPSIDGYDGGLLPVQDYARFKGLLLPGAAPVAHFTLPSQAPARPDSRLLGALNVRFLVTDGRSGAPGPGWIAREAAPGAAFVHENSDLRPRAHLVFDVQVEPDPRRALVLLRATDLTRTAVIERPLEGLHLVASSPAGEGSPAGSARISRYGAQQVEIDVETAVAGLLVISDSYYPGWRAMINGAPAPLVRANVAFRGVPVPAGRHRVRMVFDPLSVKLGFAASALAIAGNGVLWWRGSRSVARETRGSGRLWTSEPA